MTTDAAISTDLIQKALSEIVKVTYNCLSIDGDTSTNDMVCILANGLAGNEEITTEGEDYKAFSDALYQVLMSLTKMLAKDGEGASKMLECTCAGAPDQDTALSVQCLEKMPTGEESSAQSAMLRRNLILTK